VESGKWPSATRIVPPGPTRSPPPAVRSRWRRGSLRLWAAVRRELGENHAGTHGLAAAAGGSSAARMGVAPTARSAAVALRRGLDPHDCGQHERQDHITSKPPAPPEDCTVPGSSGPVGRRCQVPPHPSPLPGGEGQGALPLNLSQGCRFLLLILLLLLLSKPFRG